MDNGWSKDPDMLSEPGRALIIKSRRLGPLTLGTCRYLFEPDLTGFWFFVVAGTRIHLSGRW